jgi:hypothetical protein
MAVNADEIAVVHTPPGGWTEMPPPFLGGCTEPLVADAPDLRGLWKVVAVDVAGEPAPDHPVMGHLQRIEQCGDRVVITAGGIVHDMRADATEENGVHDVMQTDVTTPIHVVASFEDGVHVLRPVGLSEVAVTRHIEGDQMVWIYGPAFVARLERTQP